MTLAILQDVSEFAITALPAVNEIDVSFEEQEPLSA